MKKEFKLLILLSAPIVIFNGFWVYAGVLLGLNLGRPWGHGGLALILGIPLVAYYILFIVNILIAVEYLLFRMVIVPIRLVLLLVTFQVLDVVLDDTYLSWCNNTLLAVIVPTLWWVFFIVVVIHVVKFFSSEKAVQP